MGGGVGMVGRGTQGWGKCIIMHLIVNKIKAP